MRFRIVPFVDACLWIRAGSIEIAQCNVLLAVGTGKVRQHVFNDELAAAIKVKRVGRVLFINRRLLKVHRKLPSSMKTLRPHLMIAHRLQQHECGGGVRTIVFATRSFTDSLTIICDTKWKGPSNAVLLNRLSKNSRSSKW